MPGRARRLVVLTLALVVVAGLIVADAVTLHKAKPSFDRETRAFQNLLKATSTSTTLPKGPEGTAVTTTTISTSVTTSTAGPASSANSAASTSP